MKDRNKKQWALKEDVDLLESVIKTQKKIVSSVKKYSRRAGFARVKCRQGKDGSESKFFFFFYCCCCFCDCHALFTVMSCTLDCHALVTVMHFLLKTEDFVQNRLPILHFWLRKKVYSEQNLVDFRWSCGPKPGFSIVAAFFFDPSERNKVQEHFKITTQLIFVMPPTSPASFVQIGAL